MRRRLAAHRRLHHAFHVRHVDSVPRNLVAIHLHQQAGLPQFAYHGQFREARNLRQPPFDFQRLILQHIQIRPVNLHGQRTFQTGERFVHRVFRRLGVIKNHAGIRGELLLNVLGQFRFGVKLARLPGRIFVRLQSHVKFAIEKSGGVRAVIRPPQFRTHINHLRILPQNLANLRSQLRRFLVRNGVGHRRPHPQRAFIQVWHEFPADERN